MTPNPDRMQAPDPARRTLLAGAAGAAAAAMLPASASAAERARIEQTTHHDRKRTSSMSFATMKDGAQIYYKDWGSGPVVTFSHGWPLTADAWDPQMLFLASQGFRVIAHDRRGHGRSDQTSAGNDMNTYADDLATLLDQLDVRGAAMIGHSTGGGEVARYLGRHGPARASKAVLISAVPPHLAQSADNPHGVPMAIFDGLRAGVADDRAEFFRGFAAPFFGYNREGATISQGQIDSFCRQGMMGSVQGQYECVKALSETNFTADLKAMSMPALLLQGDDDQIVPIDLSSRRSVTILPHGTVREVKGAPHGLCSTHAAQVNDALLSFIRA